MVEQEIARGVAHHLVQRRPRRLRFERIVEQLLDPGGEQVLACAIPGVAQGPGAPRRGAWSARFVHAHLDLARDRAASCSRPFPAARARRNAPVISDNAVVAAPMNWRAESTGSPLPLSRSATQLA